MQIDEDILSLLQCPRGGGPLEVISDQLISSMSEYSLEDGVPDLRVAPSRMSVDLPWIDVTESCGIESGEFEYLPNFRFPPNPDKLLSSLIDLDGNGKVMLEVGCGERDCEQFFESCGFRYIAVDYEKRGGGPDLLVDAHRMPFRDKSIDSYYSDSVYEHLASPLTAALEAKRILKSGGVFWGSTAFMYGFHDHASYFHMTHAAVLLMLKQAGFTNIKILPGMDYPQAIAYSAFGSETGGWPWYKLSHSFLWAMENSFVSISNLARALVGMNKIDRLTRKLHLSGGIGFSAIAKP